MPYIKNAIINPEYLFDVPKTQLDNMINNKNISEKNKPTISYLSKSRAKHFL